MTLWRRYAGTRGVTAGLLILEEAAFIDPDLFYQVIVPLMGVSGTSVLAISTPSEDDDNYYSELMELKNPKDPSQPLFKTIRIGLACQACMIKGKGTECTHKTEFVPPWKSQDATNKVSEIMRSNRTLYMREHQGMLAGDTVYYFKAPLVQSFRELPLWDFDHHPEFLFVGVDPSGGGKQSDYSMATIAYSKGCVVLVGLESCSSAVGTDIDAMLYNHVRKLRNHRRYRHARIRLYVENNLSHIEADRVARIFNRPENQPVEIESHDESNQNRPGVPTTDVTKHAYVHLLLQLLKDNRLRVAREFVWTPQPQESPTDPERMLHELRDQLRAFRKNVKNPADMAMGAPRIVLSGKSATKKDDLLLALMIVTYYSELTRQSDEFRARCREHGWMLK